MPVLPSLRQPGIDRFCAVDPRACQILETGRRSFWIGWTCLAALLFVCQLDASAQSQSGKVVSSAKYTAAYDAFMKINRLKEQPDKEDSADDYWGFLKNRLGNQAGRVLIKRPESDFSEDAFHGWLMFVRSYGNDTGIGNCAVCHTPVDFADGKQHDVGTGGLIATPTLRGIGQKKSFFGDDSAKSLEEAITHHVDSGVIARQFKQRGVDPELGRVALTKEEIVQVAAFVRSLKSVDRAEFRKYLINVVVQPLEFDD